MKRGKVVLEFAILKDGSVAGLKIVGPSGDSALDRPAYGSIPGSNPFPPLPKEFAGRTWAFASATTTTSRLKAAISTRPPAVPTAKQ